MPKPIARHALIEVVGMPGSGKSFSLQQLAFETDRNPLYADLELQQYGRRKRLARIIRSGVVCLSHPRFALFTFSLLLLRTYGHDSALTASQALAKGNSVVHRYAIALEASRECRVIVDEGPIHGLFIALSPGSLSSTERSLVRYICRTLLGRGWSLLILSVDPAVSRRRLIERPGGSRRHVQHEVESEETYRALLEVAASVGIALRVVHVGG